MITLTATMIDGSLVTGTLRDDGTFDYLSLHVIQIDGYRFPGLAMTETTPLSSAVVEGTHLVFRIGATGTPPFPHPQDFQWFDLDTWTRKGQECFVEDHQTAVHCRAIVSVDLTTTAPVSQQVPLPGWSIGVTFSLICWIGAWVMRRR